MAPPILNPALDGGERLASRDNRFDPDATNSISTGRKSYCRSGNCDDEKSPVLPRIEPRMSSPWGHYTG
jgi:hypothetical protein